MRSCNKRALWSQNGANEKRRPLERTAPSRTGDGVRKPTDGRERLVRHVPRNTYPTPTVQ